MGSRWFVIGVAVSGVLGSSCASTARDTLVDIYNNEAEASSTSDACQVESRLLDTAVEAHVALYGTTPTALSDLVPELVREAPEDWVMTADARFVPVVGGRCEGVEITRSSLPSIGQVAVDGIADGNDAGCSTDKRQVETALDTHWAVNGYDATTMAELMPFGVEDEASRWTLKLHEDVANAVPTVVAIDGGPCDI